MSATRITRRVSAPRQRVYRAFVDARAVATWMVPDGTTSHIHQFDGIEGGQFRISVSYSAPDETGKMTPASNTFNGRFVKLVPHEEIVEAIEFESADPGMRGTMTMTVTLRDVDGGTELTAVHTDLPPGLSPEENQFAWEMALGKLATLVEARVDQPS